LRGTTCAGVLLARLKSAVVRFATASSPFLAALHNNAGSKEFQAIIVRCSKMAEAAGTVIARPA
jgi:hypothetical protein